MANDPRIEAAHPALEGRLRMYLADRADGVAGWGASVPEIVEVVLTAADAVDPLRALLADEDRAVDLIGRAMEDALGYTREEWDFLRQHNPAFLQSRPAYKAAGAVLAALREVAD